MKITRKSEHQHGKAIIKGTNIFKIYYQITEIVLKQLKLYNSYLSHFYNKIEKILLSMNGCYNIIRRCFYSNLTPPSKRL